ncbi:MAG: hypothetical protein IJZ85_01825 [Lachnospiraceae bacterium]|nr:hypothetical protein [Lachnospiraceae bacterium]
MKRLSRMGKWTALLILMLLCGGCGQAAVQKGETKTDLQLSDISSGTSDNTDSTGDQAVTGAPTEGEYPPEINWEPISTDPSEGLGVTAEDGKGSYPTYQIKIGQLSGELVKEVLLKDRSVSIKEVEKDGWFEDQIDEFYYCQDGTYVENQFGQFLFVTPEAECWPVPGLFMEEVFLKKIFPDGQDEVLTKTDWDYATMQQAKNLVAGYLDKLGVEYGSDWITFGVSGENMTAAMHQAYPDYEYPGETVEVYYAGTGPWTKTYDEEDDVYIMRIPLALEGHPLTAVDRIHLSVGGSILMREGCFAYAMVGQEGLRYLEIRWIMDVAGQSEACALITQEQAIRAVEDYTVKEKAKYHLSDVDMEFIVTEIKFSYGLYLNGDGQIEGEVFPCWEVRGEGFFQEPNYTVAVNVDAVTGEVRNISRVYDQENYTPIRRH